MPEGYFTRENLDRYLRELAKEFRRLNGTKMPAEIVLAGGASILINYGFRGMTYDMDAIIQASSCMKDAINHVGDRMKLPTGWLNTDFTRTTSYSPKLVQYSKYYKTFSNVLKVRTISAEYLIAMKLMAGREYKNDLSDVIGILMEQEKKQEPISLEMIKRAARQLYDGYEKIPEASRTFVEAAYCEQNFSRLYEECRKQELENKDILLDFQEEFPGVLKDDNLDSVLAAARAKKAGFS